MNAINEAINEAINDHSPHGLANELADAGVSAEQSGNYGEDDEVCEVAGYGRLRVRDARWVVQAYTNDFEYLIDNDELGAELDEIIKMTKAVS